MCSLVEHRDYLCAQAARCDVDRMSWRNKFSRKGERSRDGVFPVPAASVANLNGGFF